MKYKVLKKFLTGAVIAGVAAAVPLGLLADSAPSGSLLVAAASAETDLPKEETQVPEEAPAPEPAAVETAASPEAPGTPDAPEQVNTDTATDESTPQEEAPAQGSDSGETPETNPEADPQADPETDPQADPETDPQADPETDPQADPETDPQADPETDLPADPETDPQADPEAVPETETAKDPEAVPAAEAETEAAPENEPADTADSGMADAAAAAAPASPAEIAQWIASGMTVPSPVIIEDFRFWTVAQDPAFAKDDIRILEDRSDDARAVGTLAKDGLCYVLSDEEDGWLYVESGSVRGFIKQNNVYRGDIAQIQIRALEERAANIAATTENTISVEDVTSMAEELIAPEENGAFSWLRATVYQTVVEKDYAIAATAVNIRESADNAGRIVGTLKEGGLCYLIADKDSEWIYVESGDVRGFVSASDLTVGDAAKAAVEAKGENSFALATEKIEPKENNALYYTITSVKSGTPYGADRRELVAYASQFIGNPYIWGGTSLVNGADCSGFVQSIFAQYGYSLPRTSSEQALAGKKIPVESAQPGDLIFYANGTQVYHVVLYAGDGKTVEAKNEKAGIVSGTVNYDKAVWAVQILDDQQALRYEIPEGLGSVHTFMGWQKVTSRGSQQYALRESAGMAFDPEGFAVIDNRYVIACTPTFGNIGDYIDFYQADGTKIPCIIGDFKNLNDAGCNEWGHLNGQCIVEFVVDQLSWYYCGHANPGTASCHPEWNQNIVKAEKVGSYYNNNH